MRRLVVLFLVLVSSSSCLACLPTAPIRATRDASGWYSASDGCGNRVRFHPRTLEGRPNSLDNYEGGKSGLVSHAQLASLGYGPSAIKILEAMSQAESGGRFGTVGTWDNQAVSWGHFQFAGNSGSLAMVLCHLASSPKSKAAFDAYLGAAGVECKQRSPKLIFSRYVHIRGGPAGGESVPERTQVWEWARTQWDLMAAFMLAGNNVDIAMGQMEWWQILFLEGALGHTVDGRRSMREIATSEKLAAAVIYTQNHGLAYLVPLMKQWLEQHPDVDYSTADFNKKELQESIYQGLNEAHRVRTNGVWTFDRVFKDAQLSAEPGSFDDGYSVKAARCRRLSDYARGSCSATCGAGKEHLSSSDGAMGCGSYDKDIKCCIGLGINGGSSPSPTPTPQAEDTGSCHSRSNPSVQGKCVSHFDFCEASHALKHDEQVGCAVGRICCKQTSSKFSSTTVTVQQAAALIRSLSESSGTRSEQQQLNPGAGAQCDRKGVVNTLRGLSTCLQGASPANVCERAQAGSCLDKLRAARGPWMACEPLLPESQSDAKHAVAALVDAAQHCDSSQERENEEIQDEHRHGQGHKTCTYKGPYAHAHGNAEHRGICMSGVDCKAGFPGTPEHQTGCSGTDVCCVEAKCQVPEKSGEFLCREAGACDGTSFTAEQKASGCNPFREGVTCCVPEGGSGRTTDCTLAEAERTQLIADLGHCDASSRQSICESGVCRNALLRAREVMTKCRSLIVRYVVDTVAEMASAKLDEYCSATPSDDKNKNDDNGGGNNDNGGGNNSGSGQACTYTRKGETFQGKCKTAGTCSNGFDAEAEASQGCSGGEVCCIEQSCTYSSKTFQCRRTNECSGQPVGSSSGAEGCGPFPSSVKCCVQQCDVAQIERSFSALPATCLSPAGQCYKKECAIRMAKVHRDFFICESQLPTELRNRMHAWARQYKTACYDDCGPYEGAETFFLDNNLGEPTPVVKLHWSHTEPAMNSESAAKAFVAQPPNRKDNSATYGFACNLHRLVETAKLYDVPALVSSAFRIRERQQHMWDCMNCGGTCVSSTGQACNGQKAPAARVGTSMHGMGAAADFNTNLGTGCGKYEATNPPTACRERSVSYAWLAQFAHLFGFKRSVNNECWHFQYFGRPLAETERESLSRGRVVWPRDWPFRYRDY